MKNTLLRLMPVLVCFFGACTTLNNAASTVTPAQLATASTRVTQVTQDAATALIAANPQYKNDLVIADTALNAFVAAGLTDPTQLRTQILAAIPVADRTDAAPLVDVIVDTYSDYVQPWITTETSGAFATDAKTLLNAADAGLNAAMTPQTNLASVPFTGPVQVVPHASTSTSN